MSNTKNKDQLLKLEIDQYLAEHFIADTVVKTDMATLVNMAKHFAKFGERLRSTEELANDDLIQQQIQEQSHLLDELDEESETYRMCGIW